MKHILAMAQVAINATGNPVCVHLAVNGHMATAALTDPDGTTITAPFDWGVGLSCRHEDLETAVAALDELCRHYLADGVPA